jgi:hypothetical protein
MRDRDLCSLSLTEVPVQHLANGMMIVLHCEVGDGEIGSCRLCSRAYNQCCREVRRR